MSLGNPDNAVTARHIDQLVFAAEGTWRPLALGSINDVWRVTARDGNDAIVRIGPADEVIERGPTWLRANALGCEQHLLALVRPHVAQVPATIAAGFAPGRRPWVVQELEPGVLLSHVLPELSPGERRQVWREVGAFLNRLRQVPAPWFGTPDGSTVFPDWPSMVANDAAALLEDARQMGLPLDAFETLRGRVHQRSRQLAAVRRPGIIHSDFDQRHIFVEHGDEGWKISGAIDWEYGRYGDPGSEGLLVEMLTRSEENPDRMAFLDGYGAFDDGPLARPRRNVYRGIGIGWELTDAVRCDEPARRDVALAAFERWADRTRR